MFGKISEQLYMQSQSFLLVFLEQYLVLLILIKRLSENDCLICLGFVDKIPCEII